MGKIYKLCYVDSDEPKAYFTSNWARQWRLNKKEMIGMTVLMNIMPGPHITIGMKME